WNDNSPRSSLEEQLRDYLILRLPWQLIDIADFLPAQDSRRSAPEIVRCDAFRVGLDAQIPGQQRNEQQKECDEHQEGPIEEGRSVQRISRELEQHPEKQQSEHSGKRECRPGRHSSVRLRTVWIWNQRHS